LPAIRRVGKEQCAAPLSLRNESCLHQKVIAFIRRFFNHCILAPGLGELQDIPEKRIYSFRQGYQGGQPDLLILNQHSTFNGFAIEFKHPNGNGKLSANQASSLHRYRTANFKTLVSNDYDLIITELISYLSNTRLSCPSCRLKFKTEASLARHCQVIHRDPL
jgi:hypothetical protein